MKTMETPLHDNNILFSDQANKLTRPFGAYIEQVNWELEDKKMKKEITI